MQVVVASGLFLLAMVYLVSVVIGRLTLRPSSIASECHRCPAARQCGAGVVGSHGIARRSSNDPAPGP